MEFYKLLRIKEGKQFAISQAGLNLMKTEPDFSKEYTIIGQCDVNGNLIEAIKLANFSPKVDESKIPSIFEDKTKNNGKNQSNTGTGTDTGKPEAKLEPKRRTKSGSKPSADKENGNFTTGD